MTTTTTNTGRRLREELNEALRHDGGSDYIPFDLLPACSLLARRAKRYATRQEQACTYEWANGEKWDRDDERLEALITEVALTLPGVKGVKFTGDPRGFTVRLMLANGRYNTWGGAEDGWGIA